MVPFDEPLITVEPPAPNEALRRIGQNLARLVEDGSTIECGIGRIPQAMAEFLHDKKELGIHTEMFGDWIMELIECGAVTCTKKTINHGKIVASFCMGSQKLYDTINNNPMFEFHPTEYVNDPFIIAQHDKMVGINVGLEIDLTGQVCADSLGYQVLQRHRRAGGFYPGLRGAAAASRSSRCPRRPRTTRSAGSCRGCRTGRAW